MLFENSISTIEFLELNYNLKNNGLEPDAKLHLTGDELIRYYETGLTAYIFLKRDTLHKGMLYKEKTYLSFYENGNLKAGTLARSEQIQVGLNIFIFKDTSHIYFYPNGNVSSGNNILESLLISPYDFIINQGLVNFHTDGGIARCITKNSIELEIDGAPHQTQPKSSVSFYPATTIDQDISVQEAHFSEIIRWGNFELYAGQPVSFHQGEKFNKPGALALFMTTHDLLEQGFLIKYETQVGLYKNGSLSMFEIASEVVINDITLKPDQTIVELYEDGLLKSIFSEHEMVINGRHFRDWEKIHFHRDGSIANATAKQ